MSVFQKIRQVRKIQGSYKQIWPLNRERVRTRLSFSNLFIFIFIFFSVDINEPNVIDDVRGGDIAIRFWKDLRENALKETPEARVGAEDNVLVEWPVALILTRKV